MPSLPTDEPSTDTSATDNSASATNSNFNSNRIIKTIQIDNQGHYNIVNGAASGGSSDGSGSDSTTSAELHSFAMYIQENDAELISLTHVINITQVEAFANRLLGIEDALYVVGNLPVLPSNTPHAVILTRMVNMMLKQAFVAIAINPLNSVSISDYPEIKTVHKSTINDEITNTAQEFNFINGDTLLNAMMTGTPSDGSIGLDTNKPSKILVDNGHTYLVNTVTEFIDDGTGNNTFTEDELLLFLRGLEQNGTIEPPIIETDSATGQSFYHYGFDVSIILIMPNEQHMQDNTRDTVDLYIMPDVIHVITPAVEMTSSGGGDDSVI